MRVLQKGHIFLVIALFECRLCKGPSRLKLQGWVARVRCRCVPNCEHWEMSVGISAWSNVIEVNFVLKFKDDVSSNIIQCVPLATEPGISLIILTPIRNSQLDTSSRTERHPTLHTPAWPKFSPFSATASLLLNYLKNAGFGSEWDTLYLWAILENIAGPGGRSPAEMVGSNPTGSTDVCLFWLWCVVG